ncbi:MAG: hypothetical protein HZA21_04665 [Nitrospirae bacterium]|nr:hypothetical protein [Nitrospirota bacterium]
MPLIWCSISSHGFGHAAQVAPVLNELSRLVPGLKALVRTTVPPQFFAGRLDVEWEASNVPQDIGCVQRGPLTIDVEATWAEHIRFHADWEKRVREEARAIRSRRPTLLLSDISHLAVAAGSRAGIPTIGLCNLSWDLVLEPYHDPTNHKQAEALRLIQQAYGKAELMLRPTPGLPMTSFRKTVEIGPIAYPLKAERPRLSEIVGATPGERLVLVGFGGIVLESLPFDHMEQLAGYRFIVSGPVPDYCNRAHSISAIPLPFGSLLAAADILVTKPGYNMIVEAVAQKKPVVYVRRHNFADEESLIQYLHRYGRGIELSAEDFASGHWLDALESTQSLPQPAEAAPLPTGAAEAAQILAGYLTR